MMLVVAVDVVLLLLVLVLVVVSKACRQATSGVCIRVVVIIIDT